MRPKVIIIDDDRIQMRDYLRSLSAADFEALLIPSTSDLDPIIKGIKHQDASFFIIDMMMPAGRLYQKEPTLNGTFTGLFVSRDLRQRFPTIPIILWTGAHKKQVQQEAERHKIMIAGCLYGQKMDISPNILVAELKHYLKNGRFRPKYIKFIWKAVSIGLRTLGLGADIKEVAS